MAWALTRTGASITCPNGQAIEPQSPAYMNLEDGLLRLWRGRRCESRIAASVCAGDGRDLLASKTRPIAGI